MRAIVQRVTGAHITIEGKTENQIGAGLVILLGIEEGDTDQDIQWLSGKICRLRIFNDSDGVMNCSLLETGGDAMIVSQFTLYASTKKGNRPSYVRAAQAEIAIPLYNKFIDSVEALIEKHTVTGKFGAYMQIRLINDGPVTMMIDTKNRE